MRLTIQSIVHTQQAYFSFLAEFVKDFEQRYFIYCVSCELGA